MPISPKPWKQRKKAMELTKSRSRYVLAYALTDPTCPSGHIREPYKNLGFSDSFGEAVRFIPRPPKRPKAPPSCLSWFGPATPQLATMIPFGYLFKVSGVFMPDVFGGLAKRLQRF